MKKTFKNIIVTFSLFIFIGCGSEEVTEQTQAVLGLDAPNIEITGFDGSKINLKSHLGKPVVINFWASWCAPCKREAGELEEVYQFFKNRDVHFIGVASDDGEADAKKFIEEYKVTYPNGMDEKETISKSYSVLTLPITFVIDREGKINFKKIGQISEDKLKKEIRKVL